MLAHYFQVPQGELNKKASLTPGPRLPPTLLRFGLPGLPGAWIEQALSRTYLTALVEIVVPPTPIGAAA